MVAFLKKFMENCYIVHSNVHYHFPLPSDIENYIYSPRLVMISLILVITRRTMLLRKITIYSK